MTPESTEALIPISANTIIITARKEPYRSRTAINEKAVSDVPLLTANVWFQLLLLLLLRLLFILDTLLQKHGFVRYVTSDSVKPQRPFLLPLLLPPLEIVLSSGLTLSHSKYLCHCSRHIGVTSTILDICSMAEEQKQQK